MSQRKHNYRYMDYSPRKATQEEIDKILGDTADEGSLYGFVHIKDVDTGAEAFGLRGIPKKEKIKGTEKGNTHLNMACIRAERLALDRQYPGEMPADVEVVDERFMDDAKEGDIKGEYKVLPDEAEDEDIENPAEQPKPEPESEKPAAKKTKKADNLATKEQINELTDVMGMFGFGREDIRAIVDKKGWKVDRIGDFTKEQITELIQNIRDKFEGKTEEPVAAVEPEDLPL